jgi:hypothetical protein
MQMVMIKHGAGAEMAKARPEKRPIPFFFQGEKLFTFLRTSHSPPMAYPDGRTARSGAEAARGSTT